ncbi:MAG: hypothetical protein AB3N14_20790, partial [Flavobacteriaceae bacterium]
MAKNQSILIETKYYPNVASFDDDEPEIVEEFHLISHSIFNDDVQRAAKWLLEKASREEWIFGQTCYEQNLSSNTRWLQAALNDAMGIRYPELASKISASPRYWMRYSVEGGEYKNLSISDTVSILEDLSNITDLNGDTRFSAIPLTASAQAGGMSEHSFFTYDKLYPTKEYCNDSECYIETMTHRKCLDANVALMYFYKGKPSFLVSCFIDMDKNIYVRQIQGQFKARGFKSIGNDWQRKVLTDLKERLTFVNQMYVVSGKDLVFYLKHHYDSNYNAVVHDPIFDRVEATFDAINESSQTSVQIPVSLRNG